MTTECACLTTNHATLLFIFFLVTSFVHTLVLLRAMRKRTADVKGDGG